MKLSKGDVVKVERWAADMPVIQWQGARWTSDDPDAGYYFWAIGRRALPDDGQDAEYAGPASWGDRSEPTWRQIGPVSRCVTRSPKRAIDGDNGWLAPDGRWFGCNYHEHAALAGRLFPRSKDAEQWMEARGWARVQRSATDSESFVHEPRALTEVQCQRLIDYWTAQGWRTRKWERLTELL